MGRAAALFALGFVLSSVIPLVLIALTDDNVTDEDFKSIPVRLTAQLALQGTLVIGTLMLSRRYGTGSLRNDIGLSVRLPDVPVGIAAGLLAQVVILLMYLPFIWVVEGVDDSLAKVARDLFDDRSAVETVVLALALVVATPVVEELFFRGVVLRALLRNFSPRAAIFLSALIFAVPHWQPLALVAFVLLGCLLGWLVHRAGRLGPAVLAHATFNAITVLGLLL